MHEYPILCCDVSCYYNKKNVLRDLDRSYTTQPVQICELAIYVLEQQKKNTHTQQNHTFSFENYHVLQPRKIELLAWEYKPYVSSILKI